MPAEGTKNVADELRERHPGALWLAGHSLHQTQAALRHDWRCVSEADRLAVLQVNSVVSLHTVSYSVTTVERFG